MVVFIHGGGFALALKHDPGSPFYDNVGLWAAAHGFVGVTINYRLAPQFQYPAGIEDLTRLVAWLKSNIRARGGDPNKIFLWGHSAGAAHTGDYIASVVNAGKKPPIAGAILTSGFYLLPDRLGIGVESLLRRGHFEVQGTFVAVGTGEEQGAVARGGCGARSGYFQAGDRIVLPRNGPRPACR